MNERQKSNSRRVRLARLIHMQLHREKAIVLMRMSSDTGYAWATVATVVCGSLSGVLAMAVSGNVRQFPRIAWGSSGRMLMGSIDEPAAWKASSLSGRSVSKWHG